MQSVDPFYLREQTSSLHQLICSLWIHSTCRNKQAHSVSWCAMLWLHSTSRNKQAHSVSWCAVCGSILPAGTNKLTPSADMQSVDSLYLREQTSSLHQLICSLWIHYTCGNKQAHSISRYAVCGSILPAGTNKLTLSGDVIVSSEWVYCTKKLNSSSGTS
jgi:hypothetical protein